MTIIRPMSIRMRTGLPSCGAVRYWSRSGWPGGLVTVLLVVASGMVRASASIDADADVRQAMQEIADANARIEAADIAASTAEARLPRPGWPALPIVFDRRVLMPEVPPGINLRIAAPRRPDRELDAATTSTSAARVIRVLEGGCDAIGNLVTAEAPSTQEKLLLGQALLAGRGVEPNAMRALALLNQVYLDDRSPPMVAGLVFSAGFLGGGEHHLQADELLARLYALDVPEDDVRQSYLDGVIAAASPHGCNAAGVVPRGGGTAHGAFFNRLHAANGHAVRLLEKIRPPSIELVKSEFETSSDFARRQAAAGPQRAAQLESQARDRMALLATFSAGALGRELSQLEFRGLAYDADRQVFNGRLVSREGELDFPIVLPAPLASAERDKVALGGAMAGLRLAFGPDGNLLVAKLYSAASAVLFIADTAWQPGFRFGEETEARRRASLAAADEQASARLALQAANERLATTRQAFTAHQAELAGQAAEEHSRVAVRIAFAIVVLALLWAAAAAVAWLRVRPRSEGTALVIGGPAGTQITLAIAPVSGLSSGLALNRNDWLRGLAGFAGGLLIAVLGSVVSAIATASLLDSGYGAIRFFLLWAIGLFVAVKSPSAGKAWRRLLFGAAGLTFLLPLAGLVLTGAQLAGIVGVGDAFATAATLGTVLGGTLVSGLLGVLGFFLGATLLAIGFMVGRDVPAAPPSIAPPLALAESPSPELEDH